MDAVESLNWNFPRTDDGAAYLQVQLDAARAEKRWDEVCRGLIEKSYMVRWVVPDGCDDVWKLSIHLAREALDLATYLQDEGLRFRALAAGLHGVPPDRKEAALAELDRIAASLDKPELRAKATEIRARFNPGNPALRTELYQSALAQFRELGDVRSQAQCAMGLAIGGVLTQGEKELSALLAYELYLGLGATADAHRALTIANMAGREFRAPIELKARYERCVELAKEQRADGRDDNALQLLAEIELSEGNPNRALDLLNQAELGDEDLGEDDLANRIRRKRTNLRRRIERQRNDQPAFGAATEKLRSLQAEARTLRQAEAE